jgi:hypothetical protein
LNSAYPHPPLFGNLFVLFDDESLREDVWHIHGKGGLRALLRLPLELDDLGAIRERLAVARNAGLVRLDHRRVGDDDLEHFVGAGGRDDRPVLVSPEVGERAIPLGDSSEYLSCASTVVPPRTASTAVAIAIVSLVLCFMDDFS